MRQTQRMKCVEKWHWCLFVWTLVTWVGFFFFFLPFKACKNHKRALMIHQMLLWCRRVQVSVDKPVPQCCQKRKWGSALKGYIYPALSRQRISSQHQSEEFWEIKASSARLNPVVCSLSHVSSCKIRRKRSCFMWRSRTLRGSEWNKMCRDSKYIALELARVVM